MEAKGKALVADLETRYEEIFNSHELEKEELSRNVDKYKTEIQGYFIEFLLF